MRKLLFLFLLLTTRVFAAELTVHVDCTCANDGDGTTTSCSGAPGGVGAQNSLYNAEVDNREDLTTNGNNITFIVGGNCADDPGSIFFEDTNWNTTAATNCITIKTDASRANSIMDGEGFPTSTYRLEASNYYGLYLNVECIRVNGLAIKNQGGTSSNPNFGLSLRPNVKDAIIENVLLIGEDDVNTSTSNYGIEMRNDTTDKTFIWRNVVVYDFYIAMRIATSTNDVMILDNTTTSNTTLANIQIAQYGANDTIRMRNNVMDDCGTNCFTEASTWTTETKSNNVSEDGTIGTTASCTFETGADNFQLASGDSNCREAGTSLDGDTYDDFNYDIAGTSRPQNASWDIGAFEGAATGGGGGQEILTRRHLIP